MMKIIYNALLLLIFTACQSQNRKEASNVLIGGSCEGCEAIYEYGDKRLNAIDTLPGFDEYQPKLKITGTVFREDGRTPANNIIIYIYHTNRDGVYETQIGAEGWAKRHGYIRGWVRTDVNGKYTFYTFRPASYPNRDEPEHIHITIKEPDKNEYYIENYLFDDDPLLTQEKKNLLKSRGGSGVVMPELINDIYHIKRDLILGQNIPNYY